MFGGRKKPQELDLPPIATSNQEAVEILRVWVTPDEDQQLTQVTLRSHWADPGAWGIVLVDVARHVANAYGREGRAPDAVLERIRELFDAEWSNPTDQPQDLTDEV